MNQSQKDGICQKNTGTNNGYKKRQQKTVRPLKVRQHFQKPPLAAATALSRGTVPSRQRYAGYHNDYKNGNHQMRKLQ